MKAGLKDYTQKPKNVTFLVADSNSSEATFPPSIVNLNDLKKDESAQKRLNSLLSYINKLADAENIIVLAGSGTSLSLNNDTHDFAPSMGALWAACKNLNEEVFNTVLGDVSYDKVARKKVENGQEQSVPDIELLLSLCDSYIELKCLDDATHKRLEGFLKEAKATILKATNFASESTISWTNHERFLRTLALRTPKQKRLKLFTTNYDLAFEVAASNIGIIVIDGFDFSNPSRFNPAWFDYDVVNRAQISEKGSPYISNLMHLYKIHGSVDWVRTESGIQKRSVSSDAEPVFIYPSSSKYQNSYDAPYLDMMSAFIEAIQKPKTAIVCAGFGFNDKHLNNAMSMALRTNHELLLMVATMDAFGINGSLNAAMQNSLKNAIYAGDKRIALVDCSFEVLSELLPERHKPTPEDELYRIFSNLTHGVGGK